MKIKIDPKDGILKMAEPVVTEEVKPVDATEDLSKMLSDAEDLTKDVVVATRELEDANLRFAGLISKISEKTPDEEMEKNMKKKEKDLDKGVQSLDVLVEKLEDIVEQIDDAVKAQGKGVKKEDLKKSDEVKENSEKAISIADKTLESADADILKKHMKEKAPVKKEEPKKEEKIEEMPKKSSALSDEEKKNAETVVDKSTVIADKDGTKAKLALANDNTEARKILEDAGEKFSESSVQTRSASMEKKAESPIIYSDAGNKKDYDRSKSPDVSQAKKEFTGNWDTFNQANKMDKKMIVNATEKLSNNKLAKFERSLELSGEAQLKDINVDPLKTALIKNLTEAGISQKIASVCVENSFIEAKQESVEQLIKRARELYELNNVRFVEAKMTINRYIPGQEKVATVEKTASKKEEVKTVVSGVGSEQTSQIKYSDLFDSERPLGAI